MGEWAAQARRPTPRRPVKLKQRKPEMAWRLAIVGLAALAATLGGAEGRIPGARRY